MTSLSIPRGFVVDLTIASIERGQNVGVVAIVGDEQVKVALGDDTIGIDGRVDLGAVRSLSHDLDVQHDGVCSRPRDGGRASVDVELEVDRDSALVVVHQPPAAGHDWVEAFDVITSTTPNDKSGESKGLHGQGVSHDSKHRDEGSRNKGRGAVQVGQLVIAYADDPDSGRRLIIPRCPNDRSGMVLPDDDEANRCDIMRFTDLLVGRRGPKRADEKLTKVARRVAK